MNEEIFKLLSEYGLKNNEIRIFIHLIEKGRLTAYRLAKDLGVHRSTMYDILERLIDRGFINKISDRRTLYYGANEIKDIIAQIRDKENILNSLSPKLMSIKKEINHPVKILEHPHSQKQFNFQLQRMIKEGSIGFMHLLSGGPANEGYSISGEIFIEKLIGDVKKIKLKNKFDYKGIWDKKFKKDKIISHFNKLGSNRFIENLPTKVTIIIHNNGIAFLYTTEKPYVVEIENKLISEEMESYFSHLWKIAER